MHRQIGLMIFVIVLLGTVAAFTTGGGPSEGTGFALYTAVDRITSGDGYDKCTTIVPGDGEDCEIEQDWMTDLDFSCDQPTRGRRACEPYRVNDNMRCRCFMYRS